MRALDHSFCLKLSDAISASKDFYTFFLVFWKVLSKNGPPLDGVILIKEKDKWNQWSSLYQNEIQVHSPPLFLEKKYTELLKNGHFEQSTQQNKDGTQLTLPLYALEEEFACLFLSFDDPIFVDEEAIKMLSHLLSGKLHPLLMLKANKKEKRAHEHTRKRLNQEIDAQKRLLEQLHILHDISLKLWSATSIDKMLHTAVYECIHTLEIDRIAVFLYKDHNGLIQGTYGTDIHGTVQNEKWYSTYIEQHAHAKETLDKGKHIAIYHDTPLYQNNIEVGRGWNATISLWEGNQPIGWIACDNLITGHPIKSYHIEVLKLLGIIMSQHLIQFRAQDSLINLNMYLEQRVTERTEELEKINRRLTLISKEDSLTHVPNRRMLDEKLDEEWRRALRFKTNISLLIVDIDHFKEFNDTYGHSAGDQCLIKVASALSRVERRAGALLARFGGEEFVFLLPNCDKEGAQIVAKRALKAVADLAIAHDGSPIEKNVTISVGGKTTIPLEINGSQQLFEDADTALYKAKNKGKNQVFVFE